MAWHPRTEWQDPTMPVTGPAIDWSTITHAAIHYTAALDLPDGDTHETPEQIPPYLRAIQRDYVTSPKRGYSIGYNVAVDWRGHGWECRGYDIKCAANKGWNERTFAILMLVDGNDPATAEAVAAVRALISAAELRAGRTLTIVGHREIGATACPGTGLTNQINAGVFAPIPTPPPPEEDDDMTPELVRFKGYWNEILFTSAGPIHGSRELAQGWREKYGVTAPNGTNPALVTAGKMARIIDIGGGAEAQTAFLISTLHRLGLDMTDFTKSDGS